MTGVFALSMSPGTTSLDASVLQLDSVTAREFLVDHRLRESRNAERQCVFPVHLAVVENVFFLIKHLQELVE